MNIRTNTYRHARLLWTALVLAALLMLALTPAPVAAQGGYSAAATVSIPPEGILSAGSGHTCALKPVGSVDCWGWNDFGPPANFPGPFTQISAGAGHTCGLRLDGSADCWGDNSVGQSADQPGPFTQISVGGVHTCGLRLDGSADCWGDNYDGQSTDQPGPFTQLSLGGWHTCGLLLDGSVDCWGWNRYGQAADQPGPFTQISAGHTHSCALRSDGSVDCWGENGFGQVIDQLGPFTQVSAGNPQTCGLKPDGSVDCWGSSLEGQITDHPGPFTQISAGSFHTCGLKPDGSVDCWENHSFGRAADQPGPYGPYESPADNTPPAISPSVMGTLGENGWYVSDVTVSWSVIDDESETTSQSGCDTTTVNTDTSGTTVTCTATSAGGTDSESVTVKRDAALPILNPVVSPDPVLLGGSATVSSNASDALSSLASQSCDTVDTSAVGNKIVACTATDNAGNTTTANATYQVIYNFTGFFSPVDNLPVMNIVKAGNSIPVKFSLAGNQGPGILAAGYPKVQQNACDSDAPGDAIEETSILGSSGLQYDPATDTYTYVWKTQKSWSGTCRQLTVRLADGTEHIANFQFK